MGLVSKIHLAFVRIKSSCLLLRLSTGSTTTSMTRQSSLIWAGLIVCILKKKELLKNVLCKTNLKIYNFVKILQVVQNSHNLVADIRVGSLVRKADDLDDYKSWEYFVVLAKMHLVHIFSVLAFDYYMNTEDWRFCDDDGPVMFSSP